MLELDLHIMTNKQNAHGCECVICNLVEPSVHSPILICSDQQRVYFLALPPKVYFAMYTFIIDNTIKNYGTVIKHAN